jgi:hypothetical protein
MVKKIQVQVGPHKSLAYCDHDFSSLAWPRWSVPNPLLPHDPFSVTLPDTAIRGDARPHRRARAT